MESVGQFMHPFHLLFSCHLVPFSLCNAEDFHFLFAAERCPLERVISIGTRQNNLTTILGHAFTHGSVTRGCNFVHHRLAINSKEVLNGSVFIGSILSHLSDIIFAIAIRLRVIRVRPVLAILDRPLLAASADFLGILLVPSFQLFGLGLDDTCEEAAIDFIELIGFLKSFL